MESWKDWNAYHQHYSDEGKCFMAYDGRPPTAFFELLRFEFFLLHWVLPGVLLIHEQIGISPMIDRQHQTFLLVRTGLNSMLSCWGKLLGVRGRGDLSCSRKRIVIWFQHMVVWTGNLWAGQHAVLFCDPSLVSHYELTNLDIRKMRTNTMTLFDISIPRCFCTGILLSFPALSRALPPHTSCKITSQLRSSLCPARVLPM